MPRRLLTPLASALLLASTAVACGSGGGDAGAPSATQVPTSTGDPTTTTGDVGEGSEGGGASAGVEAVEVARADSPIVLTARPGDDDHLWVAERTGKVQRYATADDGTLEAVGEPVLDLSGETTTEAERGLLGLTFSPDGGRLYVNYTDLDGNTNVVRYEMAGDDVDPESRHEVLVQDQPFPNHNGGNLAFGPDGRLWVGFGDGGSADDPENRAQDPDTLLGKMVSIDPETDEVRIEVLGVRNPWRWAFDEDGSLWIGDVGQNEIEEIDHLPADQIRGANLGWSGYEGSSPYLDGEGRRPDDAVAPVFEYSHEDGNCSITGGFPYDGSALAELDGAFLFADYCAGYLRAVALDGDGAFARELDLGIQVERPISFGQDQAGEPYVLSETGGIYRLEPAG